MNISVSYFNFERLPNHIIDRLTENNLSPKFSLLKKFYYNIIRPGLPIFLRHYLQQKVNSRITFKKDFVDESFVNLLKSNYPEFFNLFEYENHKKIAVVLTHDVEDQEGFNFIPKVLELENKYGLKSSWNIVSYKYKIDDGIIKLIKENGHEIGIHGYNHDGKLYYSEKIFNERVPYINLALKKYGAVGFRSPMVHRNLLWLQKLNIVYDASCFDYDPFQPFPGGTGSIWPFIAGKFVELPYTLPQDHTIFYLLKQNNIEIWKNKARWVATNRGVILTLTHPDYLINKKHFKMYEELLDFLKSFQDAWFCLPKELASWWRKKFNSKNNI